MTALLVALLLFQDIDALLKQLGDEDPEVRDEATATLRKLQPDSTEIDDRLARLTNSRDPELAERSKRILSYRRLSHYVDQPDQLLERLASEDVTRRRWAVKALLNAGESAAPYLSDLVNDSDKEIRDLAIQGVAQFATPECAEALHRVLRNAQQREHWVECLQGLVTLKDARAKALVFSLLRDAQRAGELVRNYPPTSPEEDWSLMYTAILAAGGPFRGQESLKQLKALFQRKLELLISTPMGYPQDVRTPILRAIADWKEARMAMRTEVMKALREPDPWWMPEVADVVIKLNPRERYPELRKLATNCKYVVTVSMMLGKMRDLESVPVFLRILRYGRYHHGSGSKPVEHVSLSAAWALGQIASADAGPALACGL